MISKNDVWLITGCSKGFGRALAQQALESGYRVAVTARNPGDIDDLVKQYSEKALAVKLDVTKSEDIKKAIKATEERFGQVDVLVNNAGYGYFGAIEEGEDAGVRALFETNVFAPLNLIKAVLPGMRERRHGHVINFSSLGGIVTFPAVGYYHMTKFAIEALSETLAQEVAPFGIGVTVVEPGAFLTDFRGSDSNKEPDNRIAAYAESAGKARDNIFAGHGKQKGDPVRGAKAIISAMESDQPPLHFAIGDDAIDKIREKMKALEDELGKWETLTRSTNFAGVSR